eukprot:scaffold141981_cov31-Tisochrysis_lutea.AAC.5
MVRGSFHSWRAVVPVSERATSPGAEGQTASVATPPAGRAARSSSAPSATCSISSLETTEMRERERPAEGRTRRPASQG